MHGINSSLHLFLLLHLMPPKVELDPFFQFLRFKRNPVDRDMRTGMSRLYLKHRLRLALKLFCSSTTGMMGTVRNPFSRSRRSQAVLVSLSNQSDPFVRCYGKVSPVAEDLGFVAALV